MKTVLSIRFPVNLSSVIRCLSFIIGYLPFLRQAKTSEVFKTSEVSSPGSLPFLRGSLPFLHGSLPFLRGSLPFLRGSLPFLRGSLPFLRGYLPFLHGSLPFLRGSLPFLHGYLPFLRGSLSFIPRSLSCITRHPSLVTRHLSLIFLLFISTEAFSQSSVRDIYTYGAKGDGITLDTKAIQDAIDDCHRSGGGRVSLHSGKFLSGTLYLKSNVVLHIEAGAVLLGSRQQKDYPVIASKYPSYEGKYVTNRMLIYAEDAENIAIEGTGTIDGRGDDFGNIHNLSPITDRPRIIHFRACRNVKVRDVTLYNSSSWVQSYQSCDNLLIDGITVDSRENKDIEKARFADAPGRNTDGLDILDCRNVRIANCFINSGDDGICLKSFSRNEACSNITITNCVITTNASGIKIGTESAGGFRDITVTNCTIYDTRLGGIDIMCVDGAKVERVIVSNITLRNIKSTALFIRLGNRGRLYRTDEQTGAGSIKDVLIENIYGTGIERYGCSVTGIPGASVENIVFNNINLTFKGGDQPFLFQGEANKPVRELTADDVPEVVEKHPRGDMFGKLPAYGFYVRHAGYVTFNNVKLATDEEDKRPAFIFDDVSHVNIDRLSADVSPSASALIRLTDVRQAHISRSEGVGTAAAFLYVSGDRSENITLEHNNYRNVKQRCIVAQPHLRKQVTGDTTDIE